MSTVPTQFVAGETLTWTESLSDYPAPDWSLKYYFRGPGPGFDIECEADGSSHKATVTAEVSAACAAGTYYWQRFAEKDGERKLAGEGQTTCKPSLSEVGADAAFDGRSALKQTLDAIRAALAKTATRAQLERTVGNKTIKFMSIEELIKAETRFQQLYNQELQAEQLHNGGPFLPNVYIRLR